MTKRSKIANAKSKISQKFGTKYQKKFINYTDSVTGDDFRLKIEESKDEKSDVIRVSLPEEKSFFRGVKFSEKVRLEKIKSGEWIKILKAKFGAGAEELLGVTEINEQSELEARDIRIIAAVERVLSENSQKVKVKKIASPHARKAHI